MAGHLFCSHYLPRIIRIEAWQVSECFAADRARSPPTNTTAFARRKTPINALVLSMRGEFDLGCGLVRVEGEYADGRAIEIGRHVLPVAGQHGALSGV
jgi:hypothetical protein